MKPAGKLKVCPDCKIEKPNTKDFYPLRSKKSGRLNAHCRDCHARRNRERRRRQRVAALKHYSGGAPQCACCGETSVEFLAFDHVNGGGSKHRREGGPVINIATWLKNQGYPDGFRVLCHNCNQALGHYGYCPHQEEKGRFDDLPKKEYPQSKLYCVNNHPLFGDNVQIAPQSTGRGGRRICRTCKREANRRYRQRQKQNQ